MSKVNKKELKSIINILKTLYPDAECALKHKNVFQLLVAVILSAQTTDKSVNLITPSLFMKYPDAFAFAAADHSEVEEILKSIGMYRTKAKNLIEMSRILCDEYQGAVPDDFERLVALPGVGRKTANVVLSAGFGHQRIAVDTHVFRLANRIGLVDEKDVLRTELALMEAIPEDQWTMMHHALIFHGRRVCSARNPKCSECGIFGLCRLNGMNDNMKK